MKFIRKNVTLILVVLMSILCLISIGVAINVSIIMIKKHDQVVKATPVVQNEISKEKLKNINANKLKVQTIYFNGETIEGISAYFDGKESVFVSADSIFEKLGIKFKYYSADDILEWVIKGKKYRMRMEENSLWLGKNKVGLGLAPTVGKNHILVPVELFTHLDGYTIDKFQDKNTVFLNYYPEYADRMGKLKAFRQIGGIAYITDIFSKKTLWGKKGNGICTGVIEYSSDGTKFMFKSGEKVYLINSDSNPIPHVIPVPVDAYVSWSGNGKYLYWVDTKKNTSYVYDIKDSQIIKIGDYYLRMNLDVPFPEIENYEVLYDYQKGNRFKRVVFTNKRGDSNYSFIERNGETVIQGNLIYSPDQKKVIYYVENEGYYFAYADGTKRTFLGEAKQIRWVNNNKIFLSIKDENYILTNNGKTRVRVYSEWKMLGETPYGEVFFSSNNVLYYEKDEKETEITSLDFDCDRVYSQSVKGPYIVFSGEKKSIYIIQGKSILKAGECLLPAGGDMNPNGGVFPTISLSYSPDGKNIALFQDENGILSVIIIRVEDFLIRKVILSLKTNGDAKTDNVSMKWISKYLLMVISNNRGCAVDIKEKVKIFNWMEKNDSILYGVF